MFNPVLPSLSDEYTYKDLLQFLGVLWFLDILFIAGMYFFGWLLQFIPI